MEYKFIVTGGGTSGHINPAITIADALRHYYMSKGDSCKIIFTGRKEGLEGELVPKAGYEMKIKENAQGVVNVRSIHMYQDGVRGVDLAINDQMKAVKRAQREVDLARLHLNEAMKERKTQEILKEKAFNKFLEEMKAEENKVTDELISYKYGVAAQNGQ